MRERRRRRSSAGPSRPCLPSTTELAALGTVLCVFSRRYGGELGGWTQAAGAELRSGIDSDGWHECLQFHDRNGDCCWRLYLLPDSDFLAWEQLQSRLPAAEAMPGPSEAVAGRLWRRLSARVGGERWQSSVVRLHALRHPRALLAASPAPVSPLGVEMLRRIARIEGLDAVEDGSRRSFMDRCCADTDTTADTTTDTGASPPSPAITRIHA
jgi:hypothetical protein